MNRSIWKFPFATTDSFEISMPKAAFILDVQVQEHHPCLWALVNVEAPMVTRHFRVYGTGQPLNHAPGMYIGTYQDHGGALVFHMFEVLEFASL